MMHNQSSESDQISYVVEWGQYGWATLFRQALDIIQGRDLREKRVLEIGARYAKISALFASMGAEVWASDLGESFRDTAAAEVQKWGVEDRVHLLYGADASLAGVEDGSIDLVFTKSVLVLVPDLDEMLGLINRKLTPGGSVVFIENAYGNVFYHLLRAYKHRLRKGFKRTHYFERSDVERIGSYFPAELVRKTWLPPVYLYVGRKPSRPEGAE